MKTMACFIIPFLFGTFFSTTLGAVTTGQIAGRIIQQETNSPVSFVEIIFENAMDKMVVTSNESGYYYANHLPTGRYEMRVRYNYRTFIMSRVRVYDSYSNEIDFFVSNSDSLPIEVVVERSEPMISALASTDIKLSNNDTHQPTQSLSDVLSAQPGVDVRNGKIFVKGSSEVRFFIDGTPVMGQPIVRRIW